MSSLFSGQKKVLFEPDRGDGDGFIRLPPLSPLCSAAACQLSNSQARERASELGHQIEFYSLLIEDGGGGMGPIERASERTASLDDRWRWRWPL